MDVGAPVGLELTSGRLAGKYKLCIFLYIVCLGDKSVVSSYGRKLRRHKERI